MQDRLLLQVEADHVGDVRIDRLVVGDAGARGVDQRDVAAAVGVHQAGDAQRAVGAEAERVDEVVVDAAVDHVDPPQAAGGAHVDEVVVDDQVAAFDQLDAHLSRQEAVLEIRRVEDARREHARPSALRRAAGRQYLSACSRLCG